MIRSLMATATSALALISTSNCFAQHTPFYFKGGIGPAFTEDTDLKEFNAPVSGAKVEFDTGVQFRVAVGCFFNEWVSGELETGINYNNIRSITGASYVDASLLNAPFMANIVLQCPPSTRMRVLPYVGAGAGVSAAVLDSYDIVINNLHLSDTQSEAVFAYQGFAGLRYYLNDRMDIAAEYRYFGTSEPTWHSDVYFTGGSGHTRFGENKTHSVTFAFTYHF